MSIILATHEAEVRKIAVQGQPEQIVRENLSQKYPAHKKRADGVAQEELIPMFLKLFHKVERGETFPNSVYEPSIH
jgi:hypothetical protein